MLYEKNISPSDAFVDAAHKVGGGEGLGAVRVRTGQVAVRLADGHPGGARARHVLEARVGRVGHLEVPLAAQNQLGHGVAGPQGPGGGAVRLAEFAGAETAPQAERRRQLGAGAQKVGLLLEGQRLPDLHRVRTGAARPLQVRRADREHGQTGVDRLVAGRS